MTPLQRKQIVDSQRGAWRQHGFHPNALFWSSKEVQYLRFEVLMDVFDQRDMAETKSVLDIGCGFGEFADYMSGQGVNIAYTGIDLSSELITEGQKRYPDINLIEADLFEFDPADNSYDYVFLSGALNRQLNDNGDYAYRTIKRMFEVSKKGVAFNLLNANHEWTASRWDLQSFNPDDVMDYVTKLLPSELLNKRSSHVIIRDDYLENDFTVLLDKQALVNEHNLGNI